MASQTKCKSIFLVLVLSLYGCDIIACSSYDYGNKLKIKAPFSNTAQEQQRSKLISYIKKRTVRIFYRCQEKTTGHIKRGWGSGTILRSFSNYSLVQTAQHVAIIGTKYPSGYSCTKRVQQLDKNRKITSSYDFKILKTDKKLDLALLRIEHNYNIQTALGTKNYIGQTIHTAGYPYINGLSRGELSYTKGEVATVNVTFRKVNVYIRFTNTVKGGYSGAGLWNNKGELVGLVSYMIGNRIHGLFNPYPGYSFGPGTKAQNKFYNTKSLKYLINK